MSRFTRRLAVRLASLNDASKLCFGAAVGFALVGGSALTAVQLLAIETRLTGLTWVSLVYFVLGSIEHLRERRSKAKNPAINNSTADGIAVSKEVQKSRLAA